MLSGAFQRRVIDKNQVGEKEKKTVKEKEKGINTVKQLENIPN